MRCDPHGVKMKNENKISSKSQKKIKTDDKNSGKNKNSRKKLEKKRTMKKEILIIAIAVVVVLALSVGVTIFSITRKLDIVPTGKSNSDIEGLDIEIVKVDNEGKSPRITVKWTNETGKPVIPYPTYYIERWNGESWVSAEAEDTETSYPEETFTIPTGSMEFVEYSTAGAEFERGERYRLRTWCSVQNGSLSRMWVEFNVE